MGTSIDLNNIYPLLNPPRPNLSICTPKLLVPNTQRLPVDLEHHLFRLAWLQEYLLETLQLPRRAEEDRGRQAGYEELENL